MRGGDSSQGPNGRGGVRRVLPDWGLADWRLADRRLADRRLADRRLTDWRLADPRRPIPRRRRPHCAALPALPVRSTPPLLLRWPGRPALRSVEAPARKIAAFPPGHRPAGGPLGPGPPERPTPHRASVPLSWPERQAHWPSLRGPGRVGRRERPSHHRCARR